MSGDDGSCTVGLEVSVAAIGGAGLWPGQLPHRPERGQPGRLLLLALGLRRVECRRHQCWACPECSQVSSWEALYRRRQCYRWFLAPGTEPECHFLLCT